MAYEGWIEFNDGEFINMSRTAQLAAQAGIDSLWTDPDSVAWIETAVGGSDYIDLTQTPWYDPSYPVSTEFIGIAPLSFDGLDDSSAASTPAEYVTDGGNSGKLRNATLPIVANVAIIAMTERGAEYGLRWLKKTLRGSGPRIFCSGVDLTYFRWGAADSPVAHRRNVRMTRGCSVTRKRRSDTSSTWFVTFTLTAADPYEYGEIELKAGNLGGVVSGNPEDDGSLALTQEGCPEFDYTPIYDPLYPALIAGPSVPDFYPSNWDITDGMTFDRFWARVSPLDPETLNVVPTIVLTTSVEARMVRVSVWPYASLVSDQCDPLFSAVVTYLPADLEFTIDGERQAVYTYDGLSDFVRRSDSLALGPEAKPLEWTSFSDPEGYLVTLDVFADSGGSEGDGEVRASFSFTLKSD
jgi:hypothetical protein